MSDTVLGLQWSSAALSDVGRVRQVNEDACLALPQLGLWVVADGMGGHDAGDVASRAVVDALADVGQQSTLARMADEVEWRLETVNQSLLELAASGPQPRTIGSTVAVLIAHQWQGMCLWVGDSRVYRYRERGLQRMTRDHSEFEDLVDQGLAFIEDAASHPSSNVITRAVGGGDELLVDSVRIDLRHGDRFLLCSDGLTKELSEDEIAAYLPVGTCQQACDAMLELALERGSRDNVTLVVAECTERG